MNASTLARIGGLSFLLVLLGHTPVPAQRPDRLSVEWIFGKESADALGLPQYRWLKDGRLVWYDTRKSPELRTIEALHPATNRRERLVDPVAARASLAAALGDSAGPSVLPYPSTIDSTGRRGLYSLRGDLFVLDFPSSKFVRLTQTGSEESCAQLSPDGNNVSFVRGNDLYVYDLRTDTELRLTHDGSDSVRNGTLSWVYWEEVFGRRDIGYWWSPDSRAIAFFRTDESGVSVQHYVDFQPWTPRLIRQRYPRVGEKNPSVRVGIVDLQSPVPRWIDLSQYPHEYIVRLEWFPDSRRFALQTLNRLQTKLDLLAADRFTGNVRHILTERDTAWINMMDDLHFLTGADQLLWPSERNGYLHLYRYTTGGGLLNPVTRGSWSLRSAGGGPAYWVQKALVGVDEKAGWAYVTAQEKSPLERHLYRVRLDGTSFARISNGDGTHAIHFSPDMQYYIDRFSSVTKPPVLGLFDSKGALVRILAGPQTDVVAKFGLQLPSLFTIPARDGFPLPAQMLKPQQMVASRKYPLIVFVYGGPSAPQVVNQWQRETYWNNILLDNGFLVMSVDNRGSAAISKTLENSSSGGVMSTMELNDLVDAVRWAKAQPYVDSTRIGVWGWSGGGTYTMLAMCRSKEFKAGIAVAGVTDMRFYDSKWAEAAMKTPDVNPAGFEESTLLRYAPDIHGRLLLVHGTYDDNVHIHNTWAFADRLIRANRMFDMMIYPMRKHGIEDRAARIHLYSTMLDFWKKNL